MADLVIGSGPAGVAVALARLARGRPVILLDGGRTLGPEDAARQAQAARALEADPGQGAVRADWMAPQLDTPPGQVRRYGSDFAMEPAAATFAGGDAVALRASRAQGGLSNLWGAALLPWRPSDIADWPVPSEALDRSWRALAGVVPVAARADALAPLFPGLPLDAPEGLTPGPQIGALLRRLAGKADRLTAMGVHVGQSRVAVAVSGSGGRCRQCGMCLHGCPWGLIWSARHLLDRLRADPGLTYRPGAVVRAVSETAEAAVAHLEDGTEVRGERLFLAAGVLETARIWMRSEAGPEAMVLRDSQFAFLPMLQPRGVPRRPDRLPLNTLPQAFVELLDPALGPRSVHAQVYGWNEFYGPDLRANYGGRLPFAAPVVGRVLDAVARHLVVAQVFLHSDVSPAIGLRLAGDGRLLTEVRPNAGAGPAMTAALARIAAALRLGGLVPLRFAARTAPVGAGFHVGASLPMRATPGPGESDVLGRPRGAGRLHVVDASVLPAIPATTITFGVMGNAHRIGLEADV